MDPVLDYSTTQPNYWMYVNRALDHWNKWCKIYPGIIETRKFMEFFPSYHECGQIGSIYGQKDDGEHGPYIGHKSGKKKKKLVLGLNANICDATEDLCRLNVKIQKNRLPERNSRSKRDTDGL